ncbi:hypothetical protein DENSPDRAFT_877111 [Dentipellis sp. KUC8613]|nr:hypothetical protein DENSPDRAFT_877111 [Dentipellis sp. KUC8613]
MTAIFDESGTEASSVAAVTDFIESRRLGGQFFVSNHGRLNEIFDKAEEWEMASTIEWSLQHLVRDTRPAMRVPKIYDVFSWAEPCLQEAFPGTNGHSDQSNDTTWDWPETQESPQIPISHPKTDSGSGITSSPPPTPTSPITEDPRVDAPSVTPGLKPEMALSSSPIADILPQPHEAGKSFLPNCEDVENVASLAVSTDAPQAGKTLPSCEEGIDLEAQDTSSGSPRGDSDHLPTTYFMPSDLDDDRLTTDEGPSQDDLEDADPAVHDLAGFDTPSYSASEVDAATPLESVDDDESEFLPPTTSSPRSSRFIALNSDGDDDLYASPQGLLSIPAVDRMNDTAAGPSLPPSPGSAHSSLRSLQSHVTIVDLPDLEQELEPLLEPESALADTSALFPDPSMHPVAVSQPEEPAQEERANTSPVESQSGLLPPLDLNISSAGLPFAEEVLLSPVFMKDRISEATPVTSPDLSIAVPPPPPVPEELYLHRRSRTPAHAPSEAMLPRSLFPAESGHRRARSPPAQRVQSNGDGSITTSTPRPRSVRFQVDDRAREGRPTDARIPPLGRPKRIRSRTRTSHAGAASMRHDPELDSGNGKSRWSSLYSLVSSLSVDDSYFPFPDFVETEGIPRHALDASAFRWITVRHDELSNI